MKLAEGESKTSNPVFVVIAEDDADLSELMACVVEQVGATPVVACDGQQALCFARSYAPAVVITDLMMPRMNGDALIAALRQACVPIPPIILVSAAPHAQLLAAGADAVLAKPFDLVDLHALLHHYLGARVVERSVGVKTIGLGDSLGLRALPSKRDGILTLETV